MTLQFSKEQKKAIHSKRKHILLIAAAGSGKTSVLSQRALRMATEHEDNVLILTFSNRAAKDIRLRCQNEKISIFTYHAFAYQYIKNGQTILTTSATKKILNGLLNKMGLDKNNISIPDIISWISKEKAAGYRAKNVGKTKLNEEIASSHELYENIYLGYEKICIDMNVIDFDDMLLLFYEYLFSSPALHNTYQHIFVDEYQDTNQIQYFILRQLIQLTKANSFVVGDPRQSIYMFRGASPQNLTKYLSDFQAYELFLTYNYRSSQEIISSANNIAAAQYPKTVANQTDEKNDSVSVFVFPNLNTEANYWARTAKQLLEKDEKISIAFLFRLNKTARLVETALLQHNVQYHLAGMDKFTNYADVLDLLAWAKLVYNKNDALSFKRAFGTISGVGERTLQHVGTLDNAAIILKEEQGTSAQLKNLRYFISIYTVIKDAFEKSISYGIETIQKNAHILKKYENKIGYSKRCQRYLTIVKSLAPRFENLEEFLYNLQANDSKNEEKKGIVLSTIHKAKGLEYDYVFLPNWVQGIVPMSFESSNFEEETNIAYVALTRARRAVFLSTIEQKTPSPFLEKILPRKKWIYYDQSKR